MKKTRSQKSRDTVALSISGLGEFGWWHFRAVPAVVFEPGIKLTTVIITNVGKFCPKQQQGRYQQQGPPATAEIPTTIAWMQKTGRQPQSCINRILIKNSNKEKNPSRKGWDTSQQFINISLRFLYSTFAWKNSCAQKVTSVHCTRISQIPRTDFKPKVILLKWNSWTPFLAEVSGPELVSSLPSFLCSTKCYSWIDSSFLVSRIFYKDI